VRKLLIPIQGDFVAPRFDLATEILMARFENGEIIGEPKTIIMERPSDEGLCQMIVEENITDVVCGGIEELHYNFLVWKKVKVLDAIIGDWQTALAKALAGKLQQGEILLNQNDEQLSL
jgi:predicted Fe-Mo cluster-binding NifX family protein